VQYGRLIEAARAEIENKRRRPLWQQLFRRFVFGHLLQSPTALSCAGLCLLIYEKSGLQRLVRAAGVLKLLGKLAGIERLTPSAEWPFFFRHIGRTFPSEGPKRFRVAFLAGCIANVCFARLNEATVRVLCKNGCDVVIPAGQNCCGALHVHSGLLEDARVLARNNIDAFLEGGYDAIVTNAAGCGSTMKEYGELLKDDRLYRERAQRFSALVKDITEFLASIELNREMGSVAAVVTYQDSCHLAHAQRVRIPPRKLLETVPGLTLREMPLSDLCCGSGGVYNVMEHEMAMALLKKKMEAVNSTGAGVVATANPGCMLQLRAGVALYGCGQQVRHVVEILDEAYRNAGMT
jgi:glycolate oxidase iron-sulfur subunit